MALTLVLLEAGACALVEMGIFATTRPPYWMGFWVDGHPDFGSWRRPNATTRQRSSCFDVEVRSNSVGARDVERRLHSDRSRIVVLGDSFMAGWGVAEEARLSNLMERRLGLEHLNFAMDSFSPYQSLLVYRKLASRYDHDVVVLGVLPENDLVEIDYERARFMAGYANRFRPYLAGSPPHFEHLDYREPLLSRALRQFSYFFRALVSVAPSRVPEGQAYDDASAQAASWFYDFTPDQALRLEEILKRLADASRGKQLVVVLLPVKEDLERFALSGSDPLSRRLVRLARREGFLLINLLPLMAERGPEAWGAYFHACDYHWSEEGHRVAAEALMERMRRSADPRRR